MVKTAIARYLSRSNSSSADYIEVKDSRSVVDFCTAHLSTPRSAAGIQARLFTDIRPEVFLKSKEEASFKVDTITGISTKYQYVCQVYHTSPNKSIYTVFSA